MPQKKLCRLPFLFVLLCLPYTIGAQNNKLLSLGEIQKQWTQLSFFENNYLIYSHAETLSPTSTQTPSNSLSLWNFIITEKTTLADIQNIQDFFATNTTNYSIILSYATDNADNPKILNLDNIYNRNAIVTVQISLEDNKSPNYLSARSGVLTPRWLVRLWLAYNNDTSKIKINFDTIGNYFNRLQKLNPNLIISELINNNFFAIYGFSGYPAQQSKLWLQYVQDFNTSALQNYQDGASSFYALIPYPQQPLLLDELDFILLIVVITLFLIYYFLRYDRHIHHFQRENLSYLPFSLFFILALYFFTYLINISFSLFFLDRAVFSYIAYYGALQSIFIYMLLRIFSQAQLLPNKTTYYSYVSFNINVITVLALITKSLSFAIFMLPFSIAIIIYLSRSRLGIRHFFSLLLYLSFFAILMWYTAYNYFDYFIYLIYNETFYLVLIFLPFFFIVLGTIKMLKNTYHQSSHTKKKKTI